MEGKQQSVTWVLPEIRLAEPARGAIAGEHTRLVGCRGRPALRSPVASETCRNQAWPHRTPDACARCQERRRYETSYPPRDLAQTQGPRGIDVQSGARWDEIAPHNAPKIQNPKRDRIASRTRSAARPSQPSGSAGRLACCLLSRRERLATAESPTPSTVFVPTFTVIGRSVLARKVKHGIPRTVLSSWMPPESVSTASAAVISDKKRR